MHVLRQIHRALKPGGLLLDLHPQPADPRSEVVGGARAVGIGVVHSESDSIDIREARKRLAGVQRAGLVHLERRRMFEIRFYHDSVDAWIAYRRERQESGTISPNVLRAARNEMRNKGRRLVIRERIRASRLRRVDT